MLFEQVLGNGSMILLFISMEILVHLTDIIIIKVMEEVLVDTIVVDSKFVE
jgi:hypothetical protein